MFVFVLKTESCKRRLSYVQKQMDHSHQIISWLVLGWMFHYSNIRSFATAFEYMKLHSKVRPCLHPASKGCVLLLHACKEFHKNLILQNKNLILYPDLARASLWRFVIDKRSEQVGNVTWITPTQQTFECSFILMAKCSNVEISICPSSTPDYWWLFWTLDMIEQCWLLTISGLPL